MDAAREPATVADARGAVARADVSLTPVPVEDPPGGEAGVPALT